MFVIEFVEDRTDVKCYFKIDSWNRRTIVGSVWDATRFHTIHEAKEAANAPSFTQNQPNTSDTLEFPPNILQHAFDISLKKPRASGMIRIIEIKMEPVQTVEIDIGIRKIIRTVGEYIDPPKTEQE